MNKLTNCTNVIVVDNKCEKQHASHYREQVMYWKSVDYYNVLSKPAKDIWAGSLSRNLQDTITTTHSSITHLSTVSPRLCLFCDLCVFLL